MDAIKLNHLREKSALAKLCLKMLSARNYHDSRKLRPLPRPFHLQRRITSFGAFGVAALLVLTPLRSAMAGSNSTGHFMVSVNVVYHCKIGASVSSRGNTVHMTMHHCANHPEISSASLTNVGVYTLPGVFNTQYTFKGSRNSATAKVRYINVTF